MKTKDLIELLERNGWKFKRHGANHDIYVKDGQRESVVRHRETDEDLVKAIIEAKMILTKLKRVKTFFFKISETGLGFTEVSIFDIPFFMRSSTSSKLKPVSTLTFNSKIPPQIRTHNVKILH